MTTDTDCRKCGATMPPVPKQGNTWPGVTFKITGYACRHCGHWNDLKRRKKKRALAD